MHAATAVLIGLGVGLHAAIWGVFKDSPHEGFHWSRFLRSPVIGVLAALQLLVTLPWPSGVAGGVLMFGAAYAVERFIIETWKTFFRIEDQSKYTIPMQLAVLGGRCATSSCDGSWARCTSPAAWCAGRHSLAGAARGGRMAPAGRRR
jgi:hypothetical protein